ncbi:hypothetical protein BpHYR1_008595 [Brachionus plicatilis]|uniref:Uncharacterized protein n=1 Tax=Brachionus plicatilis TaxID=10195 RepID=A0A3M7PMG5_BRAPC|nr:hypothetical protein BpHYR1_008595 [Brachionus plicatilis]
MSKNGKIFFDFEIFFSSLKNNLKKRSKILEQVTLDVKNQYMVNGFKNGFDSHRSMNFDNYNI